MTYSADTLELSHEAEVLLLQTGDFFLQEGYSSLEKVDLSLQVGQFHKKLVDLLAVFITSTRCLFKPEQRIALNCLQVCLLSTELINLLLELLDLSLEGFLVLASLGDDICSLGNLRLVHNTN